MIDNVMHVFKFRLIFEVPYHGKCHDKSCNSHYGGQTKCRLEKRVIQHNRRGGGGGGGGGLELRQCSTRGRGVNHFGFSYVINVWQRNSGRLLYFTFIET